ncbi:hypothetical protein HO757_04450 [Streptococcus suis]|uniref:Uncharacterized protein n=1 Tax=Streptococcus suis TaxID=1307 RepID=A0A116Q9X2_STRSU|nr:hypothetical protein [Streptococcus suis]NQN59935.1 hypothetical protein [Streptococcus suis]NQP75190.1 hypothetical protein [Streptococcus suis]NQP77296.1 hypothetical protein [Streptococcus suis]NQP91617.1 hypothetical protein [Streptococcus suis]NQP93591.1 hypothetical protein [Streptococcus suis]
MYQLFRFLSLVFMGLANTILALLLFSHTILYTKFIAGTIVFSFSGLILAAFVYYSCGVLENIKLKANALDEIYQGKVRYKDYLREKKEQSHA